MSVSFGSRAKPQFNKFSVPLLVYIKLLSESSLAHAHRVFTMSNDNIRAFGIASQRIACAKPPGIDAPAAILSDSALQLLEAFRTTHNPDDLNQAMEKIEDALKATPANDSAKPRRLNVLALIQQTQYECLHDVEALSGAIHTLREASMIATNDSMRFQLAKSLRVVLGYHYDECHDIEELKAAIRANQDAVKYCPEPRALSENYNNLSEIRRQLFEVEGDPEILDLAIQDAEQAATHAVPNDPFLSVYYHTLGIALRAKWTLRKVDTHILNRAIACSERCISLPCPNPQYEPLFRNSYAVSFRAKFNLFGNINDLDKAICQYQKIFTLPVLKPRDRSMYLNNLGIALLTKFRRLGNIEDLNRGINVLDDALVFAKRRVDVGDQSMCLSNLSILLATRFESTGATGDLNKAVDCSEEALAVALKSQAPRSPWLVARFINCGNAHKMRYLRSNEAADLESTIAQYTAGWEVCDVGTPQYYYLANNLGVVYRLRYENAVQPDSADLDKAFHWHQLAIGTGSVPSAKHLSNMAKCLLSRYKRDGAKNELIEALSRIREALGKCDNSEPVRSAYLDTLGEVYLYLYLESNDTSDLDQALASYKAGMEVESAPPTLRIEAGQRASSLLEGMGRLEEAFQLLEQCVTLLPETSTRASDFVDQQHRVSGLTGLGSDACALCLTCNNDPKKAAELLESGRVVILRRLMDLRVEVEDLPKELANEYERLRLLLDPPFQYNMAPQLQQPDYVNMAHRAASDFKSLCDQIRNIPGFEKFERAIDLSEMGAVTENQSIVLINVNHRRCDAFIFTDGKVVGMRLGVGLNEIIRQVARFQVIVSKLTTYEIGTNVHSEFSLVANSEDCIQIEGEFHEILEWLWNTITSPILEELNLHIKVLASCSVVPNGTIILLAFTCRRISSLQSATNCDGPGSEFVHILHQSAYVVKKALNDGS